MAEDIITALSKLRSFFVIARNSTFAYKGKSPDVRQVARDLGVRYVLEGSVRKAGNRVRIVAQLIDGVTGNHIWAERLRPGGGGHFRGAGRHHATRRWRYRAPALCRREPAHSEQATGEPRCVGMRHTRSVAPWAHHKG